MANAIKGRGATGHLPGRFEVTTQRAVDDGWYVDDSEAFASSALRTQVTEETARSIISRNQSPDIGFSQSVNPYRGCEHGCSYCFARPSHAYLNLSPGLDFETRLFAKQMRRNCCGASCRGRGMCPARLRWASILMRISRSSANTR